MVVTLPPVLRVFWPDSVRIVSSRFPPVTIYDEIARNEDLDAAYYIESLTNERLLNEIGELWRVRAGDRLSGPGTTPIMAAFTHPNSVGTRFSNGDYGVYYAANDFDTAITETCFHRARFLKRSNATAITLEMRTYYATIAADLHDLRNRYNEYKEVYDPDSYAAGQALGCRMRDANAWGVVYQSVRQTNGECAGIFRPPALRPARPGPHLRYYFDGVGIKHVTRR